MHHCLVTGAAGPLGQRLIQALLAHGCQVRALVHNQPLDLEHPRLETVTGDVRDSAGMQEACTGVDNVFHTAAAVSLLGGRHASDAYRAFAREVNVEGTRNLLAAARRQGASGFIYTSSVDVCFEGRPQMGMDQTTPYARSPKSVYAETKIKAERAVLAANASDGLYTCAIRPDGIWGGDPYPALDGLLWAAASGALKYRIGKPDTLQDNTHVDNLVRAHILAAQHLGADGTASGRAYFVTDEAPQNNFDFFKPMFEHVGLRMPDAYLPRTLVYPLSVWAQFAHFRLGAKAPSFCPHVIDKITVSHYGSNDDIRRDLGFELAVTYEQGIAQCLPYCERSIASIRQRLAQARQ